MNYRLYRPPIPSGPILIVQTETHPNRSRWTERTETCNFATLLWRWGSNCGFHDRVSRLP
jgi:hypothetical protein